MKTQLKISAAALVLAFTATSSFAADFSTGITDVDSIHDLAKAEMVITFGNSTAEQNVGLVSQVGDNNIGYISQSSTTGGNFVAIVQDSSTTTAANVAYVFQAGNTNRAMVYQR